MNAPQLRTLAFALALASIGTALLAQGPGRQGGFGPGPGFKGLNLTESQRAQAKAIHERHQAALQSRQEAAEAARKAVHEAMLNPATDVKALQALHEKASAAQFELMLEHRALRQEFQAILTPEQKALAEKRMAEGPRAPGGRGPGRHPGMGKGPGGPGERPF